MSQRGKPVIEPKISNDTVREAFNSLLTSAEPESLLTRALRIHFRSSKVDGIIYVNRESVIHDCERSHEGMTVTVRRRIDINEHYLLFEGYRFFLFYNICKYCNRLLVYLNSESKG